jgi:hypothetical protein
MSWGIVLFNSKQEITAIVELDENQLEPTDFDGVLEKSFQQVKKNKNRREIIGTDFTIDFFVHNEPVSNTMLNLYGENGLFELIEIAKKYNWQIYDSGIGEMIDLKNPENNGFINHRKYVEQILNRK